MTRILGGYTLISLMTSEETVRQQRYKFEKHRHDALITRAFVRTVLSHYEHRDPKDWRFEKGEKDKPEITNASLPLRFNLSHTEDFIICAVCLNHDIGADVEHVDRNNDILSIADRYFSPAEIKELFSLSTTEQQRSRFFDYWTLKESYIKAWGLGLSIPLDHFSFSIGEPEVTAGPEEQNVQEGQPIVISDIRLSFAPQRQDDPEDWQSWLFYPNPSHRMALSIRSGRESQFQISLFRSVPLISVEKIELPLS